MEGLPLSGERIDRIGNGSRPRWMSSDICEVLLVLVDKYGRNIPAMPYRQETGAIKNLMQD